MSYVLAFLGFAALIILHEAGHFAAAKAVGMRVERFSLFFGPMLVKVRRGETDYGIGPQLARHRCPGAQVNGCLAATPARVVVRRGGRLMTFELRPRYDAKARRPLLGFGFDVAQKPVSAGRAASLTVSGLWTVTKE